MVQILSDGGALLRSDRPTFGTLVPHYLDAEAQLRKGALERDPALLRRALEQWETRRLDTIPRFDCESMVTGMLGWGDAFGTVWLRCVTTRRVFSLAVDAGLIDTNPWDGVTLPKPVRDRVLTHFEEPRLKWALGPGWGRLVTVAVGTGLHPSELIEHHAGAPPRRQPAAQGGHQRRRQGTGGPVAEEAAQALDEQAPNDESRRYWPYTESVAAERVRRMTVSLGWQRLTLIDLRSNVRDAVRRGGNGASAAAGDHGPQQPGDYSGYYAHLEGASERKRACQP